MILDPAKSCYNRRPSWMYVLLSSHLVNKNITNDFIDNKNLGVGESEGSWVAIFQMFLVLVQFIYAK